MDRDGQGGQQKLPPHELAVLDGNQGRKRPAAIIAVRSFPFAKGRCQWRPEVLLLYTMSRQTPDASMETVQLGANILDSAQRCLESGCDNQRLSLFVGCKIITRVSDFDMWSILPDGLKTSSSSVPGAQYSIAKQGIEYEGVYCHRASKAAKAFFYSVGAGRGPE